MDRLDTPGEIWHQSGTDEESSEISADAGSEKPIESVGLFGATRRIRTGDLLITNESRGHHHRSRYNKTREKWGFY